jgi:hypothetical protein
LCSGDAQSPAEARLLEALEALERLVQLQERAGRGATEGFEDALVDAATLGRALGVSRQFVYDHAEELGVLRLGSGSRPRLRFDLELAKRSCRQMANEKKPASARPRRTRPCGLSRPDLLPVRGA